MNLSLLLSRGIGNRLYKISIFLMAFLLCSSSMAQVAGDYKSRASGNWSDYTTWDRYNGSAWVNAVIGEVPSGTSESDATNVYLEAAFTVTLTGDAACKDLHLNGAQDVIRINTGNFALNIWGKMRSYTGTAPGTTDAGATGSGIAGWINTGTSGRLKFRGTVDRTIFVTNELSANSRTAGWRLDFAFDAGVTGFCKSTIRCGHLEVSSGILDVRVIADGEVADYEIRIAGSDYTAQPGNGTSGGTVIIRSGATLKSYRLRKNNPTSVGNSLASFTVESGAIFYSKLNNQVPALAYSILGEVRFESVGGQTLISTGGNVDAVPIVNYNDIRLLGSGTNAKTLQNSITIAGKLTMEGTASISAGSFTVAYNSNATLEYKGSTLQTSTNAEFPALNGPTNLIINNSNGVRLHANRSIEGILTLADGLFNLQNNNFTLGENSPAIGGIPSQTNMVVSSGTGELRKIFTAPGYFFFPLGDITGTTEYTYGRVDVTSGDLSASSYVGLRVIDNNHPAAASAASSISRYWSLTSNITNLNYDATLQYLSTDVNNVEGDINSYNYQDESALASGSPINRVNAILHRIVITGITSTGYITGANLCSITNNSITYTGNDEFCGASNLSSPFTGSSSVVASGTPVYQWQQKTNSGSWTDISGANSTDYTELSSLTPVNEYFFRRTVADPAYCLVTDINLSNEVSINVYDPISGNQVGSDQILSEGGSADPFTETATLSGGNGTYTYTWQTSSTLGGPYTDIPLANAATYTPTTTETAFFVRNVESGECSSLSNEISITIITSNEPSGLAAGVNVYPNPATGTVYLNLGSAQQGESKLVLMDGQGTKLEEKNYNNGQSILDLNMEAYTSGLYYVYLSINGKYIATYKVSKR